MRKQRTFGGGLRTLTFWGWAEAGWNMQAVALGVLRQGYVSFLWSTCHVLGIFLGPQCPEVNKIPAPCSSSLESGRWLQNKNSQGLYRCSVLFRSVVQSCPTLCDPMNHSTPGLPVHHQLPEFTQTHVHRVSDAIQPSHPLSSPSPPDPNPSQHQGLFQWVNSWRKVAKVVEFQL